MRLLATTSSSRTPTAFEVVLGQLEALRQTPLGRVPGTGVVAIDRALRIRGYLGPIWQTVGVDPQQAIGRLVSEVVRAPTFERLRHEYAAVLAGEPRSFALPVRDEAIHWHSAHPILADDGTVDGLLAFTWDETDGQHTDELYRVLAENASDMVTRHDLEGRYLYASPSVENVTGWCPDDLIGRGAFELIHPDDVPRVRDALARSIRELGIVTFNYRFRWADGTYGWLETTGRALVRSGTAAEFQCSSRDITKRRAAEEELARRLAQQSAVARLGEFALQRPDLDALEAEACRLVSETLEVDLVYVLGHVEDARMRVRAGIGWPEGFLGSEVEVRSFGGSTPGSRYADAAIVVDDLPSNTTLRARPLRANGVVSSATVLIGDREDPVGLLGAHTRRSRRFPPEDVDFLHAVAHVLAGAQERVRVEERIRHDALHDALTGLPNRTLLLDRLNVALAAAQRDGTRVAVLFFDLDRLKVLNDSLGHEAGDELLRAVGPRLGELLRPSDTLARFGGDEFVVLLPGLADERCAVEVAERIVRAFDRPFQVAGEARFGSASVGVAVTDPAVPRAAAELLSDADAAMYRAKDSRRGGYEVFDAGLRATITERLRLEEDLRRALEGDGGLWVAYQPFWRLPDCRLAGVEALVRWDHPTRGPIAPAEFIPIAEESGLIGELGNRVLRAACRHVARLRADTPASELSLTVNLSARQFATRGIVDAVAAVLAETHLPAEHLGLEITEGLLLEESPATVATISALQEIGVRLILDDFGTGYSSLRYLQRYPLDGLKIDRSFVGGLGADGNGDGAIVEAIIGMARALDMRVIPEGVETRGQLDRLIGLGCDFAQGFLLGRPLSAGGLETLLRAGARPAG